MDHLSPEARSRNMAAIRGRDTEPERLVRAAVRSLGLRARLCSRSLPGTPDVVLPDRHIAIFVHGCFWHGHSCKRGAALPKTRASYWHDKRCNNQRRDRRVQRALHRLGWGVRIVWECHTRDPVKLRLRLARRLSIPLPD